MLRELGSEVELPSASEDLLAAERIQDRLRSIGYHGSGLRRRSATLERRLDSTDHVLWEEGLEQLGALLGFDATHPGGTNDPDSVWIVSDRLAIVWEVKSEEEPGGEIGARTAQQAAGHERWVRANRAVRTDAKVLSLLVSDRDRLGEGADIHAGDVRIVKLDEIRKIARLTIAALTRVRTLGRTADDAALRSRILQEFADTGLAPSQLIQTLGEERLADLNEK